MPFLDLLVLSFVFWLSHFGQPLEIMTDRIKFQLSSPFISPARFVDRVSGLEPGDSVHRHNTYVLCQAINLTNLSVILEKMVNEDGLNPELANTYKTQANCLLALMLSENNRIHNL